MSIVYRRTAKGDEEVGKRTFKLASQYRFVLIMINGKVDVDNIVSRSSEQWNPVQCLKDLELQGFIENIDIDSSSPNGVGLTKQKLITCVQEYLPKKNTKIINKILNSENSKQALSKAIDGGCMFIKLTISEQVSNKLKVALHNVLDNSTEH